ncbi:peptide chain release factor N(5)-glutamine methyltransferase [Halothermothrix orenii]|uniref:Release factor glutamine methyltransferase n=1 Tax=Halothermothrix orenii (strain H 168 / OCM 544 / DSM 9562) TaxID=373903 RepID=B8CZ26_HALOH|nr:peptide chain release factor N(5)-glutamine methyltransferase [Halothermothrix orenii]ACL70545.1 modification methylase, HemK family [Halothermothrix orenii H 168]
MTVKEVLNSAIDFFKKQNIDNPRLDAEVLLAHLLDMERIQLYVKYDLPLKNKEVEAYREMVINRARGIPVAYLTGHKEFMSLDFKVNRSVLIPRPETEILVEEIISLCQAKNIDNPNIVDVGTGSGVIAVSLAHYLPGARVLGIDISDKALEVARTNIKRHNLGERVKVIKGNLLDPLIKMEKDNVNIVVSNPPYLTGNEMKKLPLEVTYEPSQALDGGADGLKIYRELIPRALKVLVPGGILGLEIGYHQADSIRDILSGLPWGDIRVLQDYSGLDRVVIARKK